MTEGLAHVNPFLRNGPHSVCGAIAARYDDEAASARAKVEMHQRTAVSYRNLGCRGIANPHMGEHCESLAVIYEQAAKENAALAQGHREMAK